MKLLSTNKMAALSLLLCTALFGLQCSGPQHKEKEGTTDQSTSRTSIDWEGTYKGVLPCADCPGMPTTLKLYRDNTFELEQSYLERDVKPLISKGKFSWAGDGKEITLLDGATHYRLQVGENHLYFLDNEGNRIKGNLEDYYTLTKELP